MECVHAKRELACVCPSTNCPRHGICCECIANHRAKGQLTGCQMPEALRSSSRSPQDLVDYIKRTQ